MTSWIPGKARRTTGVLCLLILLAGCAPTWQAPVNPELTVAPARELADTPFFPQDEYQCGPAALATVISRQGVAVSPDDIRPLVYLPDRQGSLQSEMLSAGAHYGLLAVRIPASVDNLLQQISAGNPVVVLQNTGHEWLPVWHYAVAIGYDLENRRIHLRSGTTERKTLSLDAFMTTWERSGFWGMVVAPPDAVPPGVTEADYLKAAAVLERLGQPAAARQAYSAATLRWTDSYLPWAGLGNTAWSLEDHQQAEDAWRRALQIKPTAYLVMNNLAMSLARLGCRDAALATIHCALQEAPENTLLKATHDEIRALPPGGDRCDPWDCSRD